MAETSNKPWYQEPHLRKLNFCILSLTLFSSANGFDGSLMNGLIALPQWKVAMDNPKGTWLGFINAVYALGCVLSYPLSSWVCNKYGRKPGVWAGCFLLFIGTAIQTAATGDAPFVVARLLLGFASGFFLACPLLLAETAYPTHQTTASSLYMCGWYVGAVTSAWATFATRNIDSSWAWRIPSALQIATPLLALPGFIMIDESPRWLVSKDRNEEARRVLAKIHAAGDYNSPLVVQEMNEIETALRAEKLAQSSSSWLDLVKTPGNRRRLLITISLGIFSQWSGGGTVSYYLTGVLTTVGITSVTHQTLISACLQVWNLIWATLAAFTVHKLGRRPLFLASGGIMLVAYLIITALSGSFATTGNAATGTAVIPFLFIYFFGYDIALTPFLTAYPVEIWQYNLRAKGLASMFLTSYSFNFFNIFVNPIALDPIGWKYYFVFVVVLVAMIITVWFYYVETRGMTLEGIAALFDGDDVLAGDNLDKVIDIDGAHDEEKGSLDNVESSKRK
ncbi:Putative major facilitator, sugar transporter, major facilitator superfamily [Colletotrichum destructivum]|uniref:Major facilitator, sugar transporter, major facilitator superfamily n=1 Tax=Colletotrichum destructivum TaxID=34406 RepID=A0AAX4I215_9PEZI|nr:Putative major facilitator, sugar transporter, major facilitator superfamily [Colletotrichum destructivum]